MIQVFAYLRVSHQHQVTGDGFPRQIETIRKWLHATKAWDRAMDPGVQVLWFKEEGVSGTKDSATRPQLSRMIEEITHARLKQDEQCAAVMDPRNWGKILAEAEDNGDRLPIDATPIVVVERPDRLARDLIVSELILQELKALDVKVWSAEGDLCLSDDDDPTRKLVRQIMSAIAEYEKSSIVQKLRRARERKRAKGERCEGKKPYGDLPGEKETLDEMVTLSDAGHGPSAIALQLNQDQKYGRAGKPWNRGSVLKILRRVKGD